jgi:hypothetical protein
MHLSLRGCASAASQTSWGVFVSSPPQSRKLDRKPCTVMPGCVSRSVIHMATSWRERHSMLPLGAFMRLAGMASQVEFIERGPFRLARAHRHQNGEFEGGRGDTLLGSQPSNEGRDIFVGQGGVMLGGKRSRMAWAGFRQGGRAAGLSPISQSSSLRGRQDALETAANTACRLRLGRPNRLDHLENEVGSHVSHGHVAENGIRVGGQGIAPLLPVRGVLPPPHSI